MRDELHMEMGGFLFDWADFRDIEQAEQCALDLLKALGFSREWGWRHPIDDEAEDWNEPGSWYSEDLHDGAKERAIAAAKKSGAPVFSRYVSKWVASDV